VGTKGIEGFLFETRNWGKTVAFWQALGFEVEFETDHHSGPILGTPDAATFTPPTGGEVVHGFEPQHWNVVQMLLADPDGRIVSVEAPLPEGVEAPAGHH
jgi:hypothetical protein